MVGWVIHFTCNCTLSHSHPSGLLFVGELKDSELYLWIQVQDNDFRAERQSLKNGHPVPKTSNLRTLHPFTEESELLRIRGHVQNSEFTYSQHRPVVLSPVTKLIIRTEHAHLPTLASLSLCRRCYIIGLRKAIHCYKSLCHLQANIDQTSTSVDGTAAN